MLVVDSTSARDAVLEARVLHGFRCGSGFRTRDVDSIQGQSWLDPDLTKVVWDRCVRKGLAIRVNGSRQYRITERGRDAYEDGRDADGTVSDIAVTDQRFGLGSCTGPTTYRNAAAAAEKAAAALTSGLGPTTAAESVLAQQLRNTAAANRGQASKIQRQLVTAITALKSYKGTKS
jgi:uncharacterized protein YjhX (UPF0386 family)